MQRDAAEPRLQPILAATATATAAAAVQRARTVRCVWLLRRELPQPAGAGLGGAQPAPDQRPQVRRVQPEQEVLPRRPLPPAPQAQSRRHQRQVDQHARGRVHEGRAAPSDDCRSAGPSSGPGPSPAKPADGRECAATAAAAARPARAAAAIVPAEGGAAAAATSAGPGPGASLVAPAGRAVARRARG